MLLVSWVCARNIRLWVTGFWFPKGKGGFKILVYTDSFISLRCSFWVLEGIEILLIFLVEVEFRVEMN